MTRAMLLAELLPDVAGIPADLLVTGLVQDSRQVRQGDAFVAIGPYVNSPLSVHGLGFVEQALASGASAILFEPPAPERLPPPATAIAVPGLRARMGEMASRFHDAPSRAMTMIGVTGTSGKTSTVQMIAQALMLRGRRSGTLGTLGAGLFGQARATGFTTPLVLQTHELLAGLRDAGADAVAMEVSSHALDQGRVDAVHFDVAVFSNLTRDHLDYHGGMQAYGAAKARLFAREGLRAAVVNIDDAFGNKLLASLRDADAATVGTRRLVGTSARGADDAPLRAEHVVLDVTGIAFDLVLGDARHAIRSPLLGRFNIDNLLAVAGVLLVLGEEAVAIADVLPRLEPIPGRMNRLGGRDGDDENHSGNGGGLPLVVVDYSHKPDPLQQALESLRGHLGSRGRMTCVFGCGGERDRGKRPQMASIAERSSDYVIVTDDNPRGEDGDAIVAEIMAGFERPQDVVVERDRRRAIERAIGEASVDDIVLVAGKGHETYQEVAGVKHPFDDSAVAREVLRRRA